MKKMRTAVVIAAILAAAPFSIRAEETPAPKTSPAATRAVEHAALKPRKDVKGVSNFAQVSDFLYRGAQPTAEGFAELKKLGVKTVINLRSSHDDRELIKGTGLNYIQFECSAASPKEEYVVACMKIINDPANQPVFVHCARGADRTGLMIAVFRMTHDKWTSDEAQREMPNFKFNPALLKVNSYLDALDTGALMKKVAELKMPALEKAE